MRGGVAVLFKDYMWKQAYDFHRLRDQVWFKLICMPGFKFGACYVTPHDSPYYSPQSFSDIQEQIHSEDKTVILGDMNSRMPNLNDELNELSSGVSYSPNVDSRSNMHGRQLLNLCKNHGLKPINHMQYKGQSYMGNFTYKQGRQWVSQLDWALCSKPVLPAIKEFNILQQTAIQTNHAALHLSVSVPIVSIQQIVERSRMLGSYPVHTPTLSKKPVPFCVIDKDKFMEVCPSTQSLWDNMTDDVDSNVKAVTEALYTACSSSKKKTIYSNHRNVNDATERWQLLLEMGEPKQIWNAIDWNGKFESPHQDKQKPNDQEFKAHFEKLLNPPGGHVNLDIPQVDMYVPVLDDPICPSEVEAEIKRLKPNKAAGVDGIPPGILRLLPDDWLLLITYIYNCVFLYKYPMQWAMAKLFTIFKKGPILDTGNYRGISILVALVKVYDAVLNRRFILWYKPDMEQVGGQAGRGCPEQLLALRLIMDIAKKKKVPLYITFIDYVKAYDRVDRNLLLKMLANKGCGNRFLQAIGSSMQRTTNVLGCETFDSSMGVRQGGATSCSLFTFYVNETIQILKSYGDDGFLKGLHSLLQMDDTVILATSRQAMQTKLNLLKECTDHINMGIHPTKSLYMTVNSDDKEAFILGDAVISHTEEYVYLGSIFSSTTIAQQITAHIDAKQNHVRKFTSFITKNNDAPFSVKKLVWESALKGAILYGCESWMCDNVRSAAQPYITTLKLLLGVRAQTCTDLVFLEVGCGSAKAYIQRRQQLFLKKLYARPDYPDSPVHMAIELAKRVKSSMGLYIQKLDSLLGDPVNIDIESTKQRVQISESSKRQTYVSLNPNLELHPVYSENVPEYERKSFTQIRLCSHHFKIETGRWSRIEREMRLCLCGEIQTENHVLCHCIHTEPLRQQYHNLVFSSSHDLMNTKFTRDLVRYCHIVKERIEKLNSESE